MHELSLSPGGPTRGRRALTCVRRETDIRQAGRPGAAFLSKDTDDSGKTIYREPEIGAQVDELPDGVDTVEEDGVTYYQFDSVFFEEVEDDDARTFYEVVGSPDGSDEEVEN